MNFVRRSLGILLSFGPLIFSSFITLSLAVENPTQHMKGILGGSVLFPVNIPSEKTVLKLEWDFYPTTGDPYHLCEFRDGNLKVRNRFEERLEMANETTLKIKDLEVEDGGMYKTHLIFLTAEVQKHTFNLTVYESVPTPQIFHQEASKTAEGCNVTLLCQAPGKEQLDISWETGDPRRALGSSLDGYQLSGGGWQLHISWQSGSSDSRFTCLVSNPVDQKEASFDLLRICQSDEVPAEESIVTFSCSERSHPEKCFEAVSIPTVQVEESPSDPQYAEILRRSPPEGNNKSLGLRENNVEKSPQKERLITTIYDQIRRTPDNSTEEVT